MTRLGEDPRNYQIGFLTLFLAWVVSQSDFALRPLVMAAILASTLATQAVAERLARSASPGLRSALISALSLCLLLRTESAWVAVFAGFVAIASKFLLRHHGKHFFNPTNFGIVVAVVATGDAWISPGQWGSGAILAFFLAALGLTVVRKVGRLDITVAYLACHVGLLLVRMLWLGERFAVPLHRLSSGSLILFAFFMISDPRSTPDARAGRIAFAALVAALAHALQFFWFIPSAPVWALVVVSPLTPLIDRLWPSARFTWQPKGVTDVHPSSLVASHVPS